MRYPAIKFCEAICKKASDEGWKLKITPVLFVWKKDELLVKGGGFFDSAKDIVHAACMELDKQQNWNLEVEIN